MPLSPATQARRAKYFRFAVATFLTAVTAVSADAYKQARLRRGAAPHLEVLPSVELPQDTDASSIQSRVIWIDDHTFLHLQNVRKDADKAESKVSLVRYRYVVADGKATAYKEHEYPWPFNPALSFAREPVSEVCLSSDRQNLLMTLSAGSNRELEGPHYVGLIRLNPQTGSSMSALWKMNLRPKTLMSYRTFWLPDSRHFIVVMGGECIDRFDSRQKTPGVRIAADSTVAGSGSDSTARVALRDKQVLGVNPGGELVLCNRPLFDGANQQKIESLILEMVPVSPQEIGESRQQKFAIQTTAANLRDAVLSPDGKRVLFQRVCSAPRPTLSRQTVRYPIMSSQWAVLNLETGTTHPLCRDRIDVQTGPNRQWRIAGYVSRNLGPGDMIFNPQWLPGSDYVSVSADSPTSVGCNTLWRIPASP